jgi:hypothetical protein
VRVYLNARTTKNMFLNPKITLTGYNDAKNQAPRAGKLTFWITQN